MNKVMIATIAGLFAAAVSAQTTAPAPADADKEKQQMLKDATADTGKGYGTKAAEGSAKAAKSKCGSCMNWTRSVRGNRSSVSANSKGHGDEDRNGSVARPVTHRVTHPVPHPEGIIHAQDSKTD